MVAVMVAVAVAAAGHMGVGTIVQTVSLVGGNSTRFL